MRKNTNLSLFHENKEDKQASELFCRLMKLWHNCNVGICMAVGEADVLVKRDAELKAEGFRLVCNGEGAAIYGSDKAGVVHGLAALLAHYNEKGFAQIDTTEAPRLQIRGVHLYMPPKENIEEFKRIIDMLAYLKLNTLILEVGGGMEYKNHPEINENWEHFCKIANAFPGGPSKFQGVDLYHKDSLHTELGGGSYLPQEHVRELVDYAKGYGISVVPELQMFSHAYYITSAYPQFAERAEDFYPDTVCPHNEDAYKLYFELAEEVLSVFEPTMVSIGHDEIRVLGLCDKCKNYSGHELLAYEVNRLHEFYKSKGVRIAMWCEKLQSTVNYYTGEVSGGGELISENKVGRKWVIPATHDAIYKLPKDVLFLDWLHGWSWDSQEEAERNGFQQIFGNFHGELIRNWERRLSAPCVVGGETSSWCLADEYTLGRDGIIGDLWYSAMMLWGAKFDETKHEQYMKDMRLELPLIRELLQDKRSPMVSLTDAKPEVIYTGNPTPGEYTLPAKAIPQRGIWADAVKSLPEEMHGALVGESDIEIAVNKSVKSLIFVHTSLGESSHIYSYRLPFEEWCPVVYAIRYADGKTVFANIRYGIDIGHVNMDFGRQLGYEGKTPEDSGGFGTTAEQCPDPPLYAINNTWKNSLLYSAYPFHFDSRSAYMYEWENPRPDVAVERVFALNTADRKNRQAVVFCVAAI